MGGQALLVRVEASASAEILLWLVWCRLCVVKVECDLQCFARPQVVVGSCGVDPSQLTCLAHSMGGLLSLTAAASDQRLFQRLVVCSPMIRMKVRYGGGGRRSSRSGSKYRR